MTTRDCAVCGHLVVELDKGRIVGCEHNPPEIEREKLSRRERDLAGAADILHRHPDRHPEFCF